ncbi:MAG: dockerin type I repeat-containing protein [Oscillospiraceae bacterium]|nr:dockerin type I repeat-containing protein [Oscillospiraceae bacterium]
MKRTVFAMIVLMLTTFSVFSTFASTKFNYSTFGGNEHYFFSDNNNSYYISVKNNEAMINTIGKEYTKVKFDNTIRYCHFVNNRFYFLILTDDDYTKIAVYNAKTKNYSYKKIGDFDVISDFYFSPDIEGNFYLVGSSKNLLYIYSEHGDLIKKFKFIDCINQVTTYDGNGIYVLTDKKSYIIKNLNIKQLGENYVNYPITFLNDKYAASENKIYNLGDNYSVINKYTNNLTAVFSSGIINGNGKIISYSPFVSNKATKYCKLTEKIKELYADNNSIYAFTNSGVYILSKSDLKRNIDNKPSDNDDNENISNENLVYKITPGYITNICGSTSISSFKKELNKRGYEAAVIKGGTEKTSGYIGTGMVVKLTKDGNTNSLVAIVDGDITGEGSINTKDIKLLMDYLLNKRDLSVYFRIAANVIDDGKISNADLVKIAQMKK